LGERETRGRGVGEVGLKENSAGEKARSLRRGGSDEHRKTSVSLCVSRSRLVVGVFLWGFFVGVLSRSGSLYLYLLTL